MPNKQTSTLNSNKICIPYRYLVSYFQTKLIQLHASTTPFVHKQFICIRNRYLVLLQLGLEQLNWNHIIIQTTFNLQFCLQTL